MFCSRKCIINADNLKLVSWYGYSRIREDKPISQKKNVQEKKYTHTILLPKTSFTLRLNPSKRVENDLYIYNKCKFAHLYQWQREHITGPEFILHDGPPYANGNLHMGHAINKILKDISIRHKLLQGYKIHYVPGWDCHGLPIELKVITNSNYKTLDSIAIRQRARKLAKKAIEGQMEVFQSWGIMTNWKESYFTFKNKYIKNQFNQFFQMYKMGLIYRDMKPIFWSPSSRTALAEAELEYNNQHISKAIVLGLHISSLPESLSSTLPIAYNAKALVWTTTPWTLPANQAICYNPDMSYCIVKPCNSESEVYLLAIDCVNSIQKKLGKELAVLQTFSGDLLKDAKYSHPFEKSKYLPFLPGSHVSSEMGTGLVHAAPGHGSDDFLVSLTHQIPLVNVVDEAGCFTEYAGSDLQGLSVLKDGNSQVMRLLKSLILHSEDYMHSYPYDWRTKEPVIIKASKQWFIDTDAIKTKAVELLHEIDVYPEKQPLNTLISQIQKRPYWCISRQRVWGVPIPVLFNKIDDKPIITRELLEHYNDLIDKHGSDFWWTVPTETIAPDHLLDAHYLSSTDIEKGKDILDIWFDSGISWSFVLGNNRQADLYLEGMDQFTGWFQSSLMTSTALQGKSPYKSVFVHGFAVDENGHKMSKSVGNVVDPQEIVHGGKDLKKHPAYGVDVLRWWVASHASQGVNVPVSQNIIEASAAEVHKIRIVLRFLLGALWEFTQENEPLSFSHFFSLDLWMLGNLKKFENEVFKLYNCYQYNNVCKIITNFVTNEVSATYCHLIKDRLYCTRKDDIHRYCCQFVIKHILETVSRATAPILPFLIEEVYLYYSCKDAELFFFSKSKNLPEQWFFPEAEYKVSTALRVKEMINKLFSGNTMELFAHIEASGKELACLTELSKNNELNELLQVSCSEIVEGAPEIKVRVAATTSKQCGRCRQYTSQFTDGLCQRCEDVLEGMQFKVLN